MIYASVRFLDEGEGGRVNPPQPGYHPQLKIGALMTSCVIESCDENLTTFSFKKHHNVSLRLMFEKEVEASTVRELHALFPRGSQVEFYEGSRKIAEGRVIEIPEQVVTGPKEK